MARAAKCKFYNTEGGCKLGDKCKYAHVDVDVDGDVDGLGDAVAAVSLGGGHVGRPPPNGTGSGKRELCKFFNAPGGCKFGDKCKFEHRSNEGQRFVVPAAVHEQTNAAKVEEANLGGGAAPSAEDPFHCGICLEDLQGKKVGVLPSCSHCFCFPCIMGWRQSDMANHDRTAATARNCPVCRTSSFFVVPSHAVPVDAQAKAAVVDAYRKKCAATPCRNPAPCPFGTSCMFQHSAQQAAAVPPPRFVVGADGATQAMSRSVGTFREYLQDAGDSAS